MPALPEELVQAVLARVQPHASIEALRALTTCRLVSKAFCRVASEDALWRLHFRWYTGRTLEDFPSAMEAVAQRTIADREADNGLNAIVHSSLNRLDRLAKCDMDSYDRLKELQAKYPVDVPWQTRQMMHPQWLAHSFWIKELLGFALRREALRRLTEIRHSSNCINFEQGLMLFSLFQNADPLSVQSALESLAQGCVARLSAEIEAGDLPAIAQGIHHYMESEGLRAATGDEFHTLENNFVSIVLLERRPSLPMTLVWIFASICERIGIEVHPVGFPSTVLAYVKGWKAPSRDRPLDAEPFYFNVYHNRILTRTQLASDLYMSKFSLQSQPTLLDPANTRDIVMRSARNIYNSLGLAQDNIPLPQERDRLLVSVYASAAALIMLSPARQGRQLADILSSIVEERFPLDAPFLYRELNEGSAANSCEGSRLEVASERAEALDKTGPKIKRRELDGKQVQYKVGQVFHHRHYGYLGVINGHDPVCTASMEWQRAMRLEELPHGAEQPFYNVMVDDGSTRYVAEENIEVCAEVDSVQVQTLVSLQPYLGRYFASFDWETQQFVPSADTALQYPDG